MIGRHRWEGGHFFVRLTTHLDLGTASGVRIFFAKIKISRVIAELPTLYAPALKLQEERTIAIMTNKTINKHPHPEQPWTISAFAFEFDVAFAVPPATFRVICVGDLMF